MKIRQLRYFEALAEELHFGKAAERLHIQQPPLTRQIQQIEKDLGVLLFKRTNRKVELTEEGKYFLVETKKMLAIMARAKTTLQAMGNGTSGKLHVSFVYLVLSSRFPDIVGEFMIKYPQVEMLMHDETSVEQLEAVREGTRHVGFITLNIMDTKGLSHMVVQRTNPCAAISANHPLAQKEILTLADLAQIPYICSQESYCKMRVAEVREQFHKAGLELKLGMQYRRKHTGTVFVAAGMGWTFINCDSHNIIPDGVVLKPVDCDYAPFEVAMIWNPDRMTPLVNNFLEFYKDRLGK
ncbi:LysR family transcriptional regulator [Maridesulfovibrio hydrothermalis]|uniref:Transcriptional regulator, LysR family n=1 Tax=Maridesulfovibrio hydrothermalis AM13 = DSM 14728 TaxID=1121451 RepID=L0RC87_9BACT|nr:LysR family transcriptional regulator [Maridesulfovibrio hydrothermalis]CCO23810.1 Transcriptional regulator, LysR family [Maridesulfovibrio hydrothermalis AM13 = DSM 14728]